MSYEQKISGASGVAASQADRRSIRSAFSRIFAKDENIPLEATIISPGDERLDLINSISSFLIDHGLAITARNLIAAHSAYSGLNPTLGLRIAARMEAMEPITQQWLDEAYGHDDDEFNDAAVEELVSALQKNLSDFSKSTKSARNETKDYGDTLQQHIDDLERGRDGGVMITDIIGLTRAMLDRSRKAETELRERELEARSLRRSLETARRDAEIDYLTGLPNRRAFVTLLDRHYREALAELQSLVVAFCDIDHFKRVNDTHGHEAGDRVIKAVAEMLATISDDNCHVARHGGEEFVMLFRDVTLSEAEARLNRARELVATRRFRNRDTDQPFGQITFSGGLTDVSRHDGPEAALAAADAALYRAKEGGRNRIVLA